MQVLLVRQELLAALIAESDFLIWHQAAVWGGDIVVEPFVESAFYEIASFLLLAVL